MNYIKFGDIVIDIRKYSSFKKSEMMELSMDSNTIGFMRSKPSGKYEIIATRIKPKIDTTYSDPNYIYDITLISNLTSEQANQYLNQILHDGNNLQSYTI